MIQAFVSNDMLEDFKTGIESYLGAGRRHILTIRRGDEGALHGRKTNKNTGMGRGTDPGVFVHSCRHIRRRARPWRP